MTEPRILVEPRRRSAERSELAPDPDRGWAWMGWFAGVITAVALGDFALAWFPLQLGTPEWEFGTIASSFAGLPLLTVGMAALLGSMLARGRRLGVQLVAAGLLLTGAFVLAALVIFALDVPLALRVVAPEVALGLKKAVAKTVMLGTVFSIGYITAAIAALRHVSRARSGGQA